MSFKAHEKRVKTLLVEYKNQFKSNKFSDKRIGENDNSLTLEDKMFKRFVTERQKPRDRRNNKFNLNDDEEQFEEPENKIDLTHFGQSLSQIEKFERDQLSDDDDEDENDPTSDRGRINAEFVAENFFGGFKDKEDEEGKRKNRKEWIEEMITKSKQIKYEKQKEKDRTLDLTEQLDKEWRNIMPLIGKMDKKLKDDLDSKAPSNAKPDDYDVLVRSLQFDSNKAQPTNKTKTPEELEKERLDETQKNEKDMLERMNREVELEEEDEDDKRKKRGFKKVPSNHISVDDMEFNEPEYLEMRVRDDLNEKHKKMNEELAVKNKKEKLDAEKEDEEVEGENGHKIGLAYENGFEEEEDENEEEEEDNEDLDSKKSDSEKFKNEKWVHQFETICLKLNKNSIDLKQFEKLIKTLIERLDPSKDENNKQRLCFLTQHLITYYQSIFEFKSPSKLVIDMDLVKLLTKFIFDFTFKYGNRSTKKDPSPYVTLFKNILDNLNKDYLNLKISERKFPQLNTLFTFKLVSNIFPTSDFRHQIVTPCLLIMTRYLSQCPVQTIGDLFRGSFLTNLCYDFVGKSQRFIPECVQFLNGIIYLAVDWKSLNKDGKKTELGQFDLSTIYETFKRTKVKLTLSKKVEQLKELSLVNTSLNESHQADDSTKASIIAYNLDLLIAFTKMYDSNVSFREIFNLTRILLKLLPTENYPQELKNRISKLETLIDDRNDEPREYLKCFNKKPIAGRQYEPKIQAKSKFDPRHHNEVISEKQLMARKYKKEMKSAIKDIRQDNQFLARVQLDEQMEKDAKRTQKVKEIMSSLANQEGEYQKAKRQKN